MARLTGAIVRYELALLVLAAPFLLFPNRWTGLVFGIIVAIWICRWLVFGTPSVRTPLDVPIALLLVTTAVGMYASVDLQTSWPKFWGILLGVAIYYAIVNWVCDSAALRLVSILLLLVGIGAGLVSLVITDWQVHPIYDVNWVTDHLPSFPNLLPYLPTGGIPRGAARTGSWERPDCCGDLIVLVHPREVGGTMAMLLPFAFALALSWRERLPKLLAAVGALFFASVLYLSQAVSAIVGVGTSLVILLGWRYSRLRLVIAIASLVVFAAIVVSWEYWLPRALSPGSFVSSNLVERMRIWLWALESVRNQPFTGVGLNSLDYVLVGLYPLSALYDVYHAHQLFLQVAADLGLPGLAAFVGILILLWLTVIRGLRSTNDVTVRAVQAGAGAGALAYVVFGSFDAITLGAKPGAAFWTMLGLAMAANKIIQSPAASPRRSVPRRWWIALGVSMALLFALTAPALRGILDLNLGTLEAHKVLAKAWSGAATAKEELTHARDLLQAATTTGQATEHTDALLMSINGLLGDCSETLRLARESVRSGGEQPLGPERLAGLEALFPSYRFQTEPSSLPSLVAATFFAHAPEGNSSADNASLWQRLALPRTPEVQLVRYDYMIQHMISRWGPIGRRWEPYLTSAIIANEQQHDTASAMQFLKTGMENATYKDPLACYRVAP